MTPRTPWHTPEAGVCRGTGAEEEAGVAAKDTWTPPHGCRSPMAPRPTPRRVRPPWSRGPACITLALSLWWLVQLAAASRQLPASPPPTTHLAPRLLHHSEVFTHAFLRSPVLPLSHEAPEGRRVSGAGEGRQDQAGGSGQILPVSVTSTPAAKEPPPRRADTPTLHVQTRATRSITPVRRVAMHGPPLTNRKTLFVEVVVLADYTFYRHYGTQAAALQRVTQVLGVANRVLGGVGVVLVPADVQVWSRRDQMPVTSGLKTTVNTLQQHRLSLLQRYRDLANDHTVLLTRKKMSGRGSCGGPLGGMCRKRQSVSVVQDEGKGPSVTGVTLAHQVGHSLGMEHDAQDPAHACRCAASTCVMSRHFRNASTPNLAWSVCSTQSLDSALETLALDCLTNEPTRMHTTSSCGDGVVDDGEQCDCGPAEFCDNPCCVAATCRLALNASCASGSCCDIQTCKPKPPGAVCREAVTECDLPEFCSGHSEYCPRDVTKADGAPCHEGHCFSGECGSRNTRCKRLWGVSASAASSHCYSELNVKGNRGGNCGPEQRGFRRCRKEESLCGTLHCIASASPSRLLQEHRNGSQRAGPHTCHFISGSDDYPAKHWLTPNGASCGPGKMCLEQRCEDVPRLTGECRGGCSGNGVCNSLGHCHCDAGFSPPTCSLLGLGGSVHSNVMSDSSDPRLLIRLAWVVVVLLFSLLAVTCCSWGYFKGWYKRGGRDTISRRLPCCTACLDAYCCPVMTKTARWMLTVGSSPDKKQLNRNIEMVEGENERMVCSVDVDIKNTSQTNSWGVASGKLVTEIVTIEPKDSPDLRRKVNLPSHSPLLHHRSDDNLQRPKYHQSISIDSGCVTDTDEDAPTKRTSLQLSMSSLLNILMKFGDKKPKTMPDSEAHRVKSFGSQKSIPLSRFVVDPLAGRRSSRQGTPTSQHGRPFFGRSISTDAFSTRGNSKAGTPPPPPPSTLKPNKSEEDLPKTSNRNGGTPPPPPPSTLKPKRSEEDLPKTYNRNGGTPPPPPPPTLKPKRSEENLSKTSEMPGRLPHRQHSPSADAAAVTLVPVPPGKHIQKDTAASTTTSKAPLRPPKNKPLPSPPKDSPLKHNSPPQTGNQRYQGGTPNEKAIPANTSSGAQSSSPGTAASKKVMEMARKFEAA